MSSVSLVQNVLVRKLTLTSVVVDIRVIGIVPDGSLKVAERTGGVAYSTKSAMINHPNEFLDIPISMCTLATLTSD